MSRFEEELDRLKQSVQDLRKENTRFLQAVDTAMFYIDIAVHDAAPETDAVGALVEAAEALAKNRIESLSDPLTKVEFDLCRDCNAHREYGYDPEMVHRHDCKTGYVLHLVAAYRAQQPTEQGR